MRKNRELELFVRENLPQTDNNDKAFNIFQIDEFDLDEGISLIENRMQAYLLIEALINSVKQIRFIAEKTPDLLNPREKYLMFPKCISLISRVRTINDLWGKNLNQKQKQFIKVFLGTHGKYFHQAKYAHLKKAHDSYMSIEEKRDIEDKLDELQFIWDVLGKEKNQGVRNAFGFAFKNLVASKLPELKKVVHKTTYSALKAEFTNYIPGIWINRLRTLPPNFLKDILDQVSYSLSDDGGIIVRCPGLNSYLSRDISDEYIDQITNNKPMNQEGKSLAQKFSGIRKKNDFKLTMPDNFYGEDTIIIS